MRAVFGLMIAALFVPGAALAQGQPPGDARFCQQYAETVATASEDAIKSNPACLNPGKGVHGDRNNHFAWCMRTPSDEVQGAAVHIRRLGSRCAGLLVTPEEYGGYSIIGNGQMEQPYGQARGWDVSAAFSGRLFMYCAAVSRRDGREVRIGVDQAMPGDGSQWQLVVPVKANKDWQGRLEIDGQDPASGAGADVSGTIFDDWTIAWLNMGQVDALKNGRQAVLGVGKMDYDFRLDGIAAAILKVQECRSRLGVPPAASAAQPPVSQQMAAAPPPPPPPPPANNSGANSQVIFKLRANPDLCVRNIGGRGEDSADIVLSRCGQAQGEIFLFDTKGSPIRPQDRSDQCVFINQLPEPPDYVITMACNMARDRWQYQAQAGQVRGNQNRCWTVENRAIRPGAKIVATPCRANAAEQQFDVEY